MQKLFLTVVSILGVLISSTCFAGAFNRDAGLPKIVLGEVTCYGEQELKPQFFTTFEDILVEQLQDSGKVSVEDINFNDVQDNILTEVHMNAIVHSIQFVREQAKINLVQYYRNLGHKPEIGTNVYNLDPDVKSELSNISDLSLADFILFCNVKNIEVEGEENTDTGLGLTVQQGGKVKVDIDYYLVNSKSGVVYAGTSSVDKSSQVINMIGLNYGKKLTVEQMLQSVLENQAKRISNDVVKKGIKNLK